MFSTDGSLSGARCSTACSDVRETREGWVELVEWILSCVWVEEVTYQVYQTLALLAIVNTDN